ncbi:MAG TPA: N-acetylmuramoyl-L-alanine amidase [Alphaproteobacteria bacterium]
MLLPDQQTTVAPLTHHWNLRRPHFIILHGTEVDWELTNKILRGQHEREASAHYAISQTGELVQYLDDTVRAYHAGASYWGGVSGLNHSSIGIELECISKDGSFSTAESTYSDVQFDVLIPLVKKLMETYKIDPWNILAHEDISPGRRVDPGIHFPWQKLAGQGIGLWHDLAPAENDPVVTDPARIANFFRDLTFYGYTNNPAMVGENRKDLLKAFQVHFLPWNVCGQVTEQSVAALAVLIQKKYGSF